MCLDGRWYNELGSAMELEVHGNMVSGTYHTAVGEAEGRYPITGATDMEALNQNQVVGLVVVWMNDKSNSHSVTTWSGQLQMIAGEEVLRTTWLLTHETDPEQDWKSTLVGSDVFTRHPPSEAEVERVAKQVVWSHPTKLG